jgi:TPR repeat protein
MYREGLFLQQDIERGKVLFAKALNSSLIDMEMDNYWKYDLIELHKKYLNSPIDISTKMQLLKELSSKNFEFAQFELGELYSEGIAIPKDLMKAFEFFKKAADSGHTLAMYELGLMYLDGDPVPENLNEAFKLVSGAAKAGESDAAYTLAWMYESGSGCDIDPIKAYTWYLIYSETKFSGNTDEELERVGLMLTPVEIEQAQRNMQIVFE